MYHKNILYILMLQNLNNNLLNILYMMMLQLLNNFQLSMKNKLMFLQQNTYLHYILYKFLNLD